ncbi:hypothetical protein [Stackebrandtia nassauensis]|uniref:PIN domain-containing protein n=1 Tax=Stackebrandtia nassauensis (strain DSM 44728 / CIP 108903 / NRRL B-16338 / NBRC 102104 / LLR-40K-21) TaxID=446470 RepID=D3Q963_STANL|nr:hypothetical protein [Stackebrandtia nassauensis]ADD40672.1 hypothetical protein Snas_0962 [Stackebrandtia nassauensis DSM 44728]
MTDRDIHIVLDASSIAAFARGSVSVGETLALVADASAAIGLPVLSLATAKLTVDDDHLIDFLVDHAAAEVLTATTEWRALAAATADVGRIDAADAALATIDSGADLLTAQPGLYAGLLPPERIIPVDEITDQQ